MQKIDIVELIEKNPIIKLSGNYNNRLLNKIKTNFSNYEQQLFVSSFYCYLNFDKRIDFIVDLDNVWKWLGFTQKHNAVLLLEKYFLNNIDYNIDPKTGGENLKEKNKKNGGQNIKKIFLTIKCFKTLCLKAQTKKASEIHEYYMKLEEVLQEVVEEETNELKSQLGQNENKIQKLEQEKQTAIKEKYQAVENAILVQFPVNTECIYFGTIDNKNEKGEKLIKFGHTNDLSTRINDHRKIYDNFILHNAFRVQNKVEIENLIKNYQKIKKHIRTIEINGKKKTEIIAYNTTDFTIEKLSKHIKDIIHSKTYSIDNFNRLMQENEMFFKENQELKEKVKMQEIQIKKQSVEIEYLKEKVEKKTKQLENIEEMDTGKVSTVIYQNVLLHEDEMHRKFNEFINQVCIVRADVEELSVALEGRYRLWSQTKPTKETFHALKNYLDTRFKPKRINRNHGYVGVRLKAIEYKQKYDNNQNPVETFIFNTCVFSDTGKILNSVLLREYRIWKESVNKEPADTDIKDIKEYLNASQYALKATVWTEEGNNEGYYGLSLKKHEYKQKYISSTGKKVQKIQNDTRELLGSWDTIAKAAESEGISATKMSRCVKNKTIIHDYYYTS